MTTQESKVYIEVYSAKSFVIRGDTRAHRVSLKAMGGKWANGLTDKKTNEKFGAWLFWSSKRKEIEDWISSGCKAVESRSDDTAMKRMEATLIRLEHKMTRIEDLMTQRLDRMMQIIISGEVFEEEEEEEYEHPRRLLK